MFLLVLFLSDVSRELDHGNREISVQQTQWGMDILQKISSKAVSNRRNKQ